MPLRRPPGSLSRIPDRQRGTKQVLEASPHLTAQLAKPSSIPPFAAPSGTAHFLERHRRERKWRRSDSNRRPPACKAGALPLSYAPAGEDANSSTQAGHQQRSRATTPPLRGTKFLRSKNLVGQGGLEPPTPRLSSVCSNQLSYWPRTCGVAQSGEGCAVGARRGLHHDQARRQGRYVSNNQDPR